jgi:LacI family transcriptional regulator
MATIKDIAKKLGISHATVSYVLNGKTEKHRISNATCKRVKEMALSMGYIKNDLARSIITGKTNMIGFVGPAYGSYTMDIIAGINRAASMQGYFLKLFLTENSRDIIQDTIQKCIRQRIDGAICSALDSEFTDEIHEKFVSNNIPLVAVDNADAREWLPQVVSDDMAGSEAACNYLMKLGHKKIIHITNDLSKNAYSVKRYDGFCQALKNAGLSGGDKVFAINQGGEIRDSERTTVIDAVLENKATAITCGSDHVALRVMSILSDIGMSAPVDYSITGFSGASFACCTPPPLTTVEQPFREMGARACDLLLEQLEKAPKARIEKLPTKLIIRRSCSRI